MSPKRVTASGFAGFAGFAIASTAGNTDESGATASGAPKAVPLSSDGAGAAALPVVLHGGLRKKLCSYVCVYIYIEREIDREIDR